MSAPQKEFSVAESAHVHAFLGSRPEWLFGSLLQRTFDEGGGSREHKYPKPHPYITGMRYVMKRIVPLAPCRVLDIGSPLTQSVALAAIPGIDVTVIDVRPHDEAEKLDLKWHTATATSLPFPEASWDIVTSMWVMGHVGDGRYGDRLDVDGDRKMLAEVARVLKPGGTAIIGPGLVDERCGNIYNLHRIYSWDWLNAEFARAGFEVLEREDLPVNDEVFFDIINGDVTVRRKTGVYGVAVLRKT